MEITLTTSLSAVLAQVAQSSAYTGAKRQDNPASQDPQAYERISTVDEDDPELTHFFNEARIPLAAFFASELASEGLVSEGTGAGDTYNLVLRVHDGFNQALLPAMVYNLFSYFVNSILASWLLYTHRDDATIYAGAAQSLLESLHGATIRRCFTRKMSPFE